MNKDDEDFIIINGDETDITLDISCEAAAQSVYSIDTMADCSTITLDPSIYSITGNNGNILTTGSTLTWQQDYSINPSWTGDPSVNISTGGVEIKGEGDLKIGDRSMKEFMDKVEDQLAILRPAPELEEKWDKLKELRRQYEECKQDILEKEKIMKILKEE